MHRVVMDADKVQKSFTTGERRIGSRSDRIFNLRDRLHAFLGGSYVRFRSSKSAAVFSTAAAAIALIYIPSFQSSVTVPQANVVVDTYDVANLNIDVWLSGWPEELLENATTF